MDIFYSIKNLVASFSPESISNWTILAIGLAIIFIACQFFSKTIRRISRIVIPVLAAVSLVFSLGLIPPNISTEFTTPSSNAAEIFNDASDSFTKNEPANTTIPETRGVEGPALVHFIDVGQADCVLIENGEDTILIDSGNYADTDIITNYLDGLGITQLDYFVTSHPHEDHIGSAATILRLFEVDTVIKSAADNDTACYEKMMEEIKKSDIPTEIPSAGDIYQSGDAFFQILGPVSTDKKNLNNNSIVLRYVYGDTSFLFTGDAEREEELDIIDKKYILASDVIKAGHHGSATSSSYPWLREIMPKYAVISVGKDNSYGHPHEDILSKYLDAGANIYRTDESGTIVITSDGKDLTVFSEK